MNKTNRKNNVNSKKIQKLREIRNLAFVSANVLESERKSAYEDMLMEERLTRIFSDDKGKTM